MSAPPSTTSCVELLSLTYTSAIPAPPPPCTDPTPDEQHRFLVAQRQVELKQKAEENEKICAMAEEEARTRAAAAVGRNASTAEQLTVTASGVFTNLKNAVAQVAMSIEKGASDVSLRTEAQIRQLEYYHNCDRFRQFFPDLAQQGEVLLADYACSAMHGGLQVSGHLQVTRHFLCFCAQTSSAIAVATESVMGTLDPSRQTSGSARPLGIAQVIPLATVACIQPSVALDTVDIGPPFFLPLPASTVRATALQVYSTKDRKLFQFLGFDSLISKASVALSDAVKGTALDRAYNYLDHAWRECVAVPLEGVEYA